MYLIWHTKFQGWFNTSGTWGTDLDSAQRFDRTDALLFCRRHKVGSTYGCVPVSLADLEAI